MYLEEYKAEGMLVREVVSKDYLVLIEPGQGVDWDNNRFPFRVTILSSDCKPLAYGEGHKIVTSLRQALTELESR